MWIYYVILGAIALVSWLVSNRLQSKFEYYSKVHLRNGMSGAEIAQKMLEDHGIRDVKVISTPGSLTVILLQRQLTSVRRSIISAMPLLLQ